MNILFSKKGNKLLECFFRGAYKDIIKDFSKRTGIADEKLNDYLKAMGNSTRNYIKDNGIESPAEYAISNNKYGPQLRNYLATMSFIAELDRRGLQVAKANGRNQIVML